MTSYFFVKLFLQESKSLIAPMNKQLKSLVHIFKIRRPSILFGFQEWVVRFGQCHKQNRDFNPNTRVSNHPR